MAQVFSLTYTAGQGGAAVTNPLWIQAYEGTIYGKAFGPILDNGPIVGGTPTPGYAYTKQSNTTAPYYSGAIANQPWVADEPRVPENEYENNPIVASQFQMALATDTTTAVAVQYKGTTYNDTLNTLTLYGGEWWGFTYSGYDNPPIPANGAIRPFSRSGARTVDVCAVRARCHRTGSGNLPSSPSIKRDAVIP